MQVYMMDISEKATFHCNNPFTQKKNPVTQPKDITQDSVKKNTTTYIINKK